MRYEPSADVRSSAIQFRQIYESLVETGFSAEQTMEILLALIASQGRDR